MDSPVRPPASAPIPPAQRGAEASAEAGSPPVAFAGLSFAGLSLERPRLMGVINVTPDSFSDGGETLDPDAAIGRGLGMLGDGADILDVGGESTRPGAEPVPPEVEAARVEPVVRALAAAGALISIDTRNADVMARAIEAGARIVNDVSALTHDPRAMDVVARTGACVVLMHMQGEPRRMQENPRYGDAAADVCAWLSARVAACVARGIAPECIAVDPGIGFGKTLEHNLEILARLHLYRPLGRPLVVGVSRKSFIARLGRGQPPGRRIGGSIAAALAAAQGGARILRVHDVEDTQLALSVWQGIAVSGQ
jgi:dihydropteroate synthase